MKKFLPLLLMMPFCMLFAQGNEGCGNMEQIAANDTYNYPHWGARSCFGQPETEVLVTQSNGQAIVVLQPGELKETYVAIRTGERVRFWTCVSPYVPRDKKTNTYPTFDTKLKGEVCAQ
jgi:hypothetical protein